MNEDRKNIASVGGLVGKMIGGKITDSHAEGTIISNGSAVKAGGLVGHMEGGEIENSTSNMRIISTEDNVFNEIRTALEQIDKLDTKQGLIQLVNDMEDSAGECNFTEKYRAFISSVADHFTILAPFIPRLSEFLK